MVVVKGLPLKLLAVVSVGVPVKYILDVPAPTAVNPVGNAEWERTELAGKDVIGDEMPE